MLTQRLLSGRKDIIITSLYRFATPEVFISKREYYNEAFCVDRCSGLFSRTVTSKVTGQYPHD
jgi:hypothetical protein